MANTVQLDFALMGLCFESVYEEFGEFPGYGIRISLIVGVM